MHCPEENRAGLLKNLESEIQCYVEENDVTDFSQVIAHYGAPKTVIASFLEMNGMETVNHSIVHKQRVLSVVLGLVIASSLAAVSLSLLSYHLKETFCDGTGIETIHIFLVNSNDWPDEGPVERVRRY